MANHNLLEKKCVACDGGVKPLDRQTIGQYLDEIPQWTLSADGLKIFRRYEFADFVKAVVFVQAIADVAEAEGHHPDIHISYNKVLLELFTHAIGGLSENDFIVAAKIDQIKIY